MPELETAQASPTERNWAMIAHLAAFAFYVVPTLGHIIGPLVVWYCKKDDNPFVRDQGREALNFNIWITVLYLFCIPFMFIVIGFFMAGALHLFHIIMIVIAAIHASDGKVYRYPLTVRFIN